MSSLKKWALKHQANDKFLPDIYTFIGRNIGLAHNYGAPLCEKSAQRSWPKEQNFGLARNVGSVFFRLLSSAHHNTDPQYSGKFGLHKSKMTEYQALRNT